MFKVKLTFYTDNYEDCGKTDGISASGRNLNDGGNYIAAPQDIPFGTQIYIEELGQTFEVQDRGGAIIYENGVMKLDVFIPGATSDYISDLGVKYSNANIMK